MTVKVVHESITKTRIDKDCLSESGTFKLDFIFKSGFIDDS